MERNDVKLGKIKQQIQCKNCGCFDLVLTSKKSLFTYSLLKTISGAGLYYIIIGYVPGRSPYGYPLNGEKYMPFYLWVFLIFVATSLIGVGVLYFFRSILLKSIICYCRNCKSFGSHKKNMNRVDLEPDTIDRSHLVATYYSFKNLTAITIYASFFIYT